MDHDDHFLNLDNLLSLAIIKEFILTVAANSYIFPDIQYQKAKQVHQ